MSSPVLRLALRLEPRPRINLSVAVRVADIGHYSEHLMRGCEEGRAGFYAFADRRYIIAAEIPAAAR